jgi:hypothetical protein
VMERASFSLGRQAPARTRTLIPSTLREMEGLQGQKPCALSIFLVYFFLLYHPPADHRTPGSIARSLL